MKLLSAAFALSTVATVTVATSVNAASLVSGALSEDGYNYVLQASSGFSKGGDGGPYFASAGISPGTAFAVGSYLSSDGNYQQAYARADYTYRIEATATDEFYEATGLVGLVSIPLFYNWSLLAEGGTNGGIADASVQFSGGPNFYIREARVGGRTVQSGTYSFLTGTTVKLTALVNGDGRAIADPFGGVDPDWEYAQFANLINIDTSPVLFDSVTDGVSAVPLPASGIMLIAGFLGVAAISRRQKNSARV
ncbi:VPLPA-CTERM sorting domain-containing protein [Roseobacter litoralis]|uniref:VPLPA-CTERM sorting domain-containing protein n=1 Tax=Roseobacter litoralis TaxID=42443 RepID=UPI0024929FE0|nr:VPLPA-CTERM sorting domain-containing protein [Roseobacter litoralis]